MEAFSISKMKIEHIEQIFMLEKVSFEDPWSMRSIASELRNDISHFFVAETKDEKADLVGYIGTYIVYDECYINNLAVFPEYRRRGIASKLVMHACEFAKAGGARFISLEVRQSNLEAKKLYEKCGFEIKGKRLDYYRKPCEDALIMTKDIKEV